MKYLDDDMIIERPNPASSGEAASGATEHVGREVPAWSGAAKLGARTATPKAASRATEHVERDVPASSGAAPLPARAARPKAASGATETVPLPMGADTTSGATEHDWRVPLDPDTGSESASSAADEESQADDWLKALEDLQSIGFALAKSAAFIGKTCRRLP